MTAYALLDLHLITPVMVTGPGGGDPNSEVTLPYLPGSAIRGLFVARYTGIKLASKPEFSRLFLNGSVRYLNGYLLQDGKRSLPTPLSWQIVKDSDLGQTKVEVFDIAVQALPEGFKEPFKNLGGSYVRDGSNGYPVKPERQITIHIAREDRQATTQGDSTVFRYDSLAAGQTFRAVVIADDPADLETLRASLPNGTEATMGRSHRAGYGLVCAKWHDTLDGEDGFDLDAFADDDEKGVEEWREYETGEAQQGNLIVTLLSDCLVRETTGGAYSVTLEPVVGQAATTTFARTCVVGGFNRKWNLPLPQGTAIEAGSVFVYDYSPELAAKLAELAVTGVGERTVEGFGRIAVNWQSKPKLEMIKTGPQRIALDVTVSKQLNGNDQTLATTMVQRLAEAQVEQALANRLSHLRIKIDNKTTPSKSQLARLRIVAKQDLRSAVEARAHGRAIQSMQALSAYLDNNRLRKPARDQLQRARIDQKSLLVWLQKLAQEPQTVWHELDFQNAKLQKIGEVEISFSDADAVYYASRLVDAVCRQAAKADVTNTVTSKEENDG